MNLMKNLNHHLDGMIISLTTLLLNWSPKSILTFIRNIKMSYIGLELSKEDIPLREIGFNDDGEAIVVAPFGKNRGIFIHGKSKVKGFYPVKMYQFACKWEAFVGDKEC